MYTINGRIEGIAPFLYNRMADSSVLDAGVSGQRKSLDQKQAEAELKVYKHDTRGLYLPRWNFKKCIIEGSSKAGLKRGKAGLGKFIEATVFVADDLYFGRDEHDGMSEVVGKIPPRTGAAAIIRRPMMDAGWSLPFTLTVVDDRTDADSLRVALTEGGMLVGLGSWRPEYGRFIVTDWKSNA